MFRSFSSALPHLKHLIRLQELDCIFIKQKLDSKTLSHIAHLPLHTLRFVQLFCNTLGNQPQRTHFSLYAHIFVVFSSSSLHSTLLLILQTTAVSLMSKKNKRGGEVGDETGENKSEERRIIRKAKAAMKKGQITVLANQCCLTPSPRLELCLNSLGTSHGAVRVGARARLRHW